MRTGRFYEWLTHQDRDGQVGALIEQVQADTEFPRWVASRRSAREYLQSRSVRATSLAALEEAWDEFEKTDWGI